MKIEKKLILCSILAIAIGIATVVPAAFFMNTKAQTYDDTWFNLDVPYAYFKANATNTEYQTVAEIDIQASLSQTAVNNRAEARIEYFEFTIYVDDIELEKQNYFYSITSSDNEDTTAMFEFSRENWFNSSDFGVNSGGGSFITDPAQLNSNVIGGGGIYTTHYTIDDPNSDEIYEKYGKILDTMENAQTIYLEVRRVGYVTFEGNNTVVTLASNPVILQIELTKNGDAFTFGNPAPLKD